MALTDYRYPDRQLLRDAIGWKPHSPQQLEVLDSSISRNLLSGGEQGGKSEVTAEYGYERSFEWERPVLGWLIGRKYGNCEKEFDYMVGKYGASGCLEWYSQGSPDKARRIRLVDGSVWKTITAAESMNITKEAPDIILACEASQLSYESYRKIRARQAASSGLLFMSGTFEMTYNWYQKLWLEWQRSGADGRSFRMESWHNTHIYAGGRTDPEILALERAVGQDFFEERIAGIPRKPEGLVFGKEFNIDLHIQACEYIRGLPVHLAVDPGYSQSAHAVLAIQTPPDSPIRIFDEVYAYRPTEHMIYACQQKPWWVDVPNGFHVIDHAAKSSGENPPAGIWAKLAGVNMASRKVEIMDGVDRIKALLMPDPFTREPQIVIDPSCEGTLSEFGVVPSPLTGDMMPYQWLKDREGRTKGLKPRDLHNHSIKALTYWVISRLGYTLAQPQQIRSVLH